MLDIQRSGLAGHRGFSMINMRDKGACKLRYEPIQQGCQLRKNVKKNADRYKKTVLK